MSSRTSIVKSSRSARGSLSTLYGLIRHRRARYRNLTELMTLDGGRLQDIGLTEEARQRIIRNT